MVKWSGMFCLQVTRRQQIANKDKIEEANPKSKAAKAVAKAQLDADAGAQPNPKPKGKAKAKAKAKGRAKAKAGGKAKAGAKAKADVEPTPKGQHDEDADSLSAVLEDPDLCQATQKYSPDNAEPMEIDSMPAKKRGRPAGKGKAKAKAKASVAKASMDDCPADEKKTFARRFCPSTSKGQARWKAIRYVFERHLLPHLTAPSKHEDFSSTCFWFCFGVIGRLLCMGVFQACQDHIS